MKKYFLGILAIVLNIGIIYAQESRDTTKSSEKGVLGQLEEQIEKMDDLFINPNKSYSKKKKNKTENKKSMDKIIDFSTGINDLGSKDKNFKNKKSTNTNNSLFISSENCNRKKNKKQKDEIHSLFGGGSNGFYLGVDARLINYYDWKSSGMNFRMAWIKHHNFSMGLEAGFYGQFFEYNPVLDAKTTVSTGYGGLVIEFALFPKWPIHLTFPISSGVGIATLLQQKTEYSRYSTTKNAYYMDAIGDFSYAYFQPGAQIEINLLRHLRLGFGLSYLYTSPIGLSQILGNELNYPTGNISLKIGKF